MGPCYEHIFCLINKKKKISRDYSSKSSEDHKRKYKNKLNYESFLEWGPAKLGKTLFDRKLSHKPKYQQ